MTTQAEVQTLLETLFVAEGGFNAEIRSWPSADDRRLSIEVVADEGACADCLVPKDVLRGIVTTKLDLGSDVVVDFTYPADAP
jgi:hypothetical protein